LGGKITHELMPRSRKLDLITQKIEKFGAKKGWQTGRNDLNVVQGGTENTGGKEGALDGVPIAEKESEPRREGQRERDKGQRRSSLEREASKVARQLLIFLSKVTDLSLERGRGGLLFGMIRAGHL